MKKRILLILFTSILIGGCVSEKKEEVKEQKIGAVTSETFINEGNEVIAGVEGSNGERYYLGAKKLDAKKLSLLQVAPNPSISANVVLPKKEDLSDKFPIPGDQGEQNSCVAWAVAYAYKSFQEKIDQGWDVNSDKRRFSPSYVYNQINKGKDQGSYIHEAMQLIVDQGVATLDKCPYTNFLDQPSNEARDEAKDFKAKSWGTIDAGNIDKIKRHLASGDAIVIGIPVYDDFTNLSPSNPIYGDTSGELAKVHGYHAIAVVGYDDDKQALKIVNSWGSNWGINGYGWIAYDFMRDQGKDIQAYTMVDVKKKVVNNDEVDTTKVPVVGSINKVEVGQDIVISGKDFGEGVIVYIRGNNLDEEATIKSMNATSIIIKNIYAVGDYNIWIKNENSDWSEAATLNIVEKAVLGIPKITYITGNSKELVISGENFGNEEKVVYIRGNDVDEYMTIKSSNSNEIRVENRYNEGVYQIWVRTENSDWSEVYYVRIY